MVTTRQVQGGKGDTSMSNIATDAEKTPPAAAQPSEPETKPKKATKAAKPAKGTKAARKARTAKKPKPAKKAAPAKKGGDKGERTNKKADVITMMRRAKGVTLAEIMEVTQWQAHTVRG